MVVVAISSFAGNTEANLKEEKMKEERLKYRWAWWLVIIALLGLAIGLVSSMARAMSPTQKHQCMVVAVDWVLPDSTPVQSFGCADVRGDTLILIPHLVGGEPKGAMGILKKDIRKITALQAAESATLKPRIG